ncbi:TIGR03086 family metal-binding protein [Nocardioides aurantiacus]|uniref:TIGR03086 family metal-binding protein n=1 Tax=Nocardioides aurantiacus TaxID=86796 RepID=UPI00403F36B4
MTPAEEFREIGGRFGEVVDAVRSDQWDDPTPVDGWRTRDVVGHLIEWFPAMVHDLEVRLPPGPAAQSDPAAAWRAFAAGVISLLEDPAAAALVPTNPNFGGVPLDRAIARFFTPDVFHHTWDLATAAGQLPALDPERCESMLASMEPIDQLLRDSGQYGPRVEVPADADAETRLVAFLGRDPFWSPPRT